MGEPASGSSEPLGSASAQEADAGEGFYSGALARIRRFMLLLGVAATIVVWVIAGWRPSLGVLAGSAVAYLNFHWLKQAMSALAEGVIGGGRAPGNGSRVVLRFLLRYVLIAFAAYGIFLISRASLYGFLGGLFLSVAAIFCEAAYELFVSFRRGI